MSLRNKKVIMLSLSGDNFTEFDSILWFKFNLKIFMHKYVFVNLK